jgi:hypothetical protein
LYKDVVHLPYNFDNDDDDDDVDNDKDDDHDDGNDGDEGSGGVIMLTMTPFQFKIRYTSNAFHLPCVVFSVFLQTLHIIKYLL